MIVIIINKDTNLNEIISNHSNSDTKIKMYVGGKWESTHCSSNVVAITISFDIFVDSEISSIKQIYDYTHTFKHCLFKQSDENNTKYNLLLPKFNEITDYFNKKLQCDNEFGYLDRLNYIKKYGERIPNIRTGTECISIFDMDMSFTLLEENVSGVSKYRIPILTTKKIYTKGVILELLWFLKGMTDTKWLSDQGVKFWDANTSKEALEKNGLDYEVGQLGPGYGHQWVNWGGDFRTRTGGINQIERIINTLKTDPSDRRIILSAWNVADLHKMALPPCHLMYMFMVTDFANEKKTLNCKVILRSNDMFLGAPFNIMSAAVLMCIIAKSTNMVPGKLTMSITNAHIYSDHIDQVKEQLKRIPLKPPLLEIKKEINDYSDISELEYSDFEITEYASWPTIKADMTA